MLEKSGRSYAGITKRIYSYAIKDFEKVAGTHIDEVRDPEIVRKWVVSLEGEHKAIRTRQTYMSAIRLYFRDRPELLKELPRLKTPSPKTVLPRTEIKDLMRKQKSSLRDEAIISICYSELTLKEILSLSVKDVDLEKGCVRIEMLPDEPRTKRLRRATIKILRKYVKTIGKESKLFPFSERTAQKILRKYHPYATASLLRRSFIQHAYEIGRSTLVERKAKKARNENAHAS